MMRDLTGLSFAVFLCASVFQQEAWSHPAHAKPVNYPYVVGFERFHSSLDDDEYLAQGGMILLNELNCVACHEPPSRLKEQLQGVEATNLAGVASRLDDIDLEIMIRNPRFVKKDTVMPSLFAGPDRDLEEVKALKHYLATFSEEVPDYPLGDIERGRSFYHRVGCAACHAPEVGYRTPGIPENAEIEMAGLPSVPMNLADLYDLDALTHFLLTPNQHRPSGRMPEFHLSLEEAADLAAYLKAGPDLELPANVTDALTDSIPFELDPALAKKGESLFVTKSCRACHTSPDGNSKRDLHSSLPLARLDFSEEKACLSARPKGGGIPFYGLDEVQKRAITAALVRLADRQPLSGAEEIDWRMKSLNCYACHERDGVGGAETAREVYFGFETEKAVELGRWGHLPPDLTGVGARLNHGWLEQLLPGDGGMVQARNYLTTRMPRYAAERVKPLAKAFRRDDEGETLLEGLLHPPVGREFEAAAFLETECRSCHGVGDQESTGLPGINLRLSSERLQYPYFKAMILAPQTTQPGVPMVPAFENEAEAEKKIESLWRYLKGRQDSDGE
ncbi:MAG: c-type cytochrome [Verrucomicrobiales bacterium]|nr:c-type cytochrome [Verrucomicrobiales bacterium]